MSFRLYRAMRPLKALRPRPISLFCYRGASTASRVDNIIETQTRASSVTMQEEAAHEDDAQSTGVILRSVQESLIYFDHVLPLRRSKFDFKQDVYATVFGKTNAQLQADILQLAQLPENAPDALKLRITSFVPIKRDGGVFVKFAVPPLMGVDEFNKAVQENTQNRLRGRYLSFFTRPRCYPVKGVPWIEDLRRFPSNRLRMLFEGPDLTEEEIYLLMRRYGVISDIIPPPPGTKDVPRFAEVKFRSLRAAVTAKNCTTGLKLGDTVIHIKYIPMALANLLKDLFVGHTKIMVPLLLALLATLAVVIFDPIREWFIEAKITQKYSLQTYKDNVWVKPLYIVARQLTRLFSSVTHMFHEAHESRREEGGLMWTERYEMAKQVRLWMDENQSTFIVIQGPRGSGKHLLIKEHVLAGRENVLYIDCEKMMKSRNEVQLIRNVAHELGYFPIFPWLNSISTFIDLGVQGLTGQKSGLAESKESQIKNMFALVISAVRNIALEKYEAAVIPEVVVKEGEPVVAPVVKEEDYLTDHPEVKPVIVIDRFATKAETNSFVYRELAEFAASVVSLNTGHVIFITDEVGSQQVLSEALPNQIFKTVLLSDALAESAQQYVLTQLKNSTRLFPTLSQNDLREAIAPLGGRMLDLQALIRRIVSGEEPHAALDQMVHQSAEQVTQKMRAPGVKYTQAQAWEVVKLLADRPSIVYRDIYKSALLKDPNTLAELERNELVLLIKDKGIVLEVKPGKPLYSHAFKNLTSNNQIYTFYEKDSLAQLIAIELAKVKSLEEELVNLRAVSDHKLFRLRIEYLGAKISASTERITKMEAQLDVLSRRLNPPPVARSSWF